MIDILVKLGEFLVSMFVWVLKGTALLLFITICLRYLFDIVKSHAKEVVDHYLAEKKRMITELASYEVQSPNRHNLN